MQNETQTLCFPSYTPCCLGKKVDNIQLDCVVKEKESIAVFFSRFKLAEQFTKNEGVQAHNAH